MDSYDRNQRHGRDDYRDRDRYSYDDERGHRRDEHDERGAYDRFGHHDERDYGWHGSSLPDYDRHRDVRDARPPMSRNYMEDREFSGRGGYGEDRHMRRDAQQQQRFDRFDDRAARGGNGDSFGYGYGRDDRGGRYDDGRDHRGGRYDNDRRPPPRQFGYGYGRNDDDRGERYDRPRDDRYHDRDRDIDDGGSRHDRDRDRWYASDQRGPRY